MHSKWKYKLESLEFNTAAKTFQSPPRLPWNLDLSYCAKGPLSQRFIPNRCSTSGQISKWADVQVLEMRKRVHSLLLGCVNSTS